MRPHPAVACGIGAAVATCSTDSVRRNRRPEAIPAVAPSGTWGQALDGPAVCGRDFGPDCSEPPGFGRHFIRPPGTFPDTAPWYRGEKEAARAAWPAATHHGKSARTPRRSIVGLVASRSLAVPVRRRCPPLLLLVLMLQVPAFAQQVATDPPTQWQADAKANKKAAKQAEKAAERAVPRQTAAAGGPAPDGEGPGGGQGGPGGPGGEGGPPGGPPGGGSGARRASGPLQMLRPEMDFAAPLTDTLLLYRTRESVVFGRPDSSDVVILPLSGAHVQIAPGVQALLHDNPDGMVVEISTSNGIRVSYRYTTDAQDADSLRVHIRAEGHAESQRGGVFEVDRVYHRGNAAKRKG